MATHDYVIDNSTGANVRSDINNVLQAILTNNSSSSAPSTTAAYMWWADTTNGILKIRNSANDGWVELLQLDGTLTLEDGSASTPALAFRDDLDTGIFSSGANSLDIATGGSVRAAVNSTGVEVTGSVHCTADFRMGEKLKHLSDQDTFISFPSNDHIGFTTNNNTRMTIDDSGNVGIGTTTPSINLTVVGSNEEDLFHLSTGNTGGNTFAGVRGDNEAGIRIRGGGSERGGEIELAGGARNSDPAVIKFSTNTSNSFQERMRISSAGTVGIATSSPDSNYSLDVNGSMRIGDGNNGRRIQFSRSGLGDELVIGVDGTGVGSANDAVIQSSPSFGRPLIFGTNNAERMRIHSTGKISINTTNNNGQLTVNGTSNAGHYVPSAAGGQAQSGIHVGGNHGNSGERGGAISFSAGGTGAAAIAARNESTDRDQIGMEFFTHNNSDHTVAADRRIRMSVGGSIYFGDQDINDPANNNSVGVTIMDSLGFLSVCRDSDIPLVVGITGSDTQLIRFMAQGSQEGNISVSGGSVSYNGGVLTRWSQIKGISTTDKSARPTIYQGTVMSNLDDLCVWSYPDQLYTEQDKTDDQIPEGKAVGDVKKAAHTEENQQLNMTKISDSEGDKDVAGIFWSWDDTNDDYYVNDYYIAMTGDMVIRVAGSTTVARGDLMISAGDGTAKPQADDIVRSSTIAKITSTNPTATYADGSKAYPCVLMAC
tara:strand:- start:1263 stop:3395 length:2133 start_codon:yes stop_codon:yes gene_type:complete